MRSRLVSYWFVGLLFFFVASGQAQVKPAKSGPRESITTADFQRVKVKVDRLVNRYSSANVLVVVDIDNTLLAMNQDLGSDQWFNWQNDLLNAGEPSNDLVAADFAGLLEVQGTLFSLSKMHPPEPELPKLIKAIQATGATTIVLTSRGYNFRDAAERELRRNGYDFSATALPIRERRGTFMPFDPARPAAYGLTRKEVESLQSRLGPVTYSNGIYMTAGQHKGFMLKTLLARSKRKQQKFEAIVFVDDHQKHTSRMHEAFQGDPLHLVTYRYAQEDGNVSNFKASSKRHVVEDWEQLRDFIDGVLVR